MKLQRNAIASVALSAVLASTLGFGLVGCSAPASNNAAQNTTTTQNQPQQSSTSASDGKYQVANGTVGFTEAIKDIDIEWEGGEVIVSAVPASAFSFLESTKDKPSDEGKAHYYLENGTLHIRATASSFKGSVGKKTLIVNVPGGVAFNSVSVKGSNTAVTINAPALAQATVKTSGGAIECGAGEAMTKCTLETSGAPIAMKVPAALGFTLNADAAGGAVACSVGEATSPSAFKNGSGACQISLKTTGATISVDLDQ